MEKQSFEKLQLNLYHEKLDNGLNIYIVPKENINNKYVTFVTNFGAMHNEFIPNGKDEMVKVPDGVAHFLEHKAFEQEDGVDPFTYFIKHGCDSNASTDSYKTMYLFSGPINFENNLEYLLDFVQTPYFTDENVESEKGIIVQEVEMYKDAPYRVLYEKSVFNSFKIHPIRYSGCGSVESVNAITKEDLYTCYNTFYHPANMFVVITGSVDPLKTIEIIKNNQAKKEYTNDFHVTVKKYLEPDTVFKEKEILKMDVTISKFSINYKFNISKLNMNKNILMMYLSIFSNIKFGSVSLFSENLKKDNIITSDMETTIIYTDNHLLLMISNDTEKPDELENKIMEEILIDNITEDDFNRKKKICLSSLIHMSDDIFSINSKVINDVIINGEVNTNIYNDINNMNFEELKNILSNLSFDNHSTLIINPKN